jgi:hypothetical protein
MGSNSTRSERNRDSRWSIVLVLFLAIAGYFLITEHLAHTLYVLPWLLVLACPLLHLWHHSGHGSHEDQDTRAREQARTDINIRAGG